MVHRTLVLPRTGTRARATLATALGLLAVFGVPSWSFGDEPAFRRGDANLDARLDISDPVSTLEFLFLGGAAPRCADAADANDDGRVDISDPLVVLNFLFLGVAPRVTLGVCGFDRDPDLLPDCAVPVGYCASPSRPELTIVGTSPDPLVPFPEPFEGERFDLHVAIAYADPHADIVWLDRTIVDPEGSRVTTRESFAPGAAAGVVVVRHAVDATHRSGVHRLEFTALDVAGAASPPATLEILVASDAPRPVEIVGFEPTHARAGDVIRILGNGFPVAPEGDPPLELAVLFDGAARGVTAAASANAIDIAVPDGAMTGPVAVETSAGIAVSTTDLTVDPTVRIEPATHRLLVGRSVTLSASVSGIASNELAWTLDGFASPPASLGRIEPAELSATYTAPGEAPASGVVTLRATSLASPGIHSDLAIEVVPEEPTAGAGLIRAAIGGTVRSLDGRLAITIPPRGIARDARIAATVLDPASLPRRPSDHVILAAGRFDAASVELLSPATLSLALASRESAGTILTVFAIHPTTGEFVDTGRRLALDPTGLRGSIGVDHLSDFAVGLAVGDVYRRVLAETYASRVTEWRELVEPPFRMVVAPGFELFEGLEVPVELIPSPEAVDGPVGPFHAGVDARIVFTSGALGEVPISYVQPSADGWRLGLVLPLPVLEDCHGARVDAGGVSLAAQRRVATLRLAYADDTSQDLRFTIDCLCELDLEPPTPIDPVPYGLDGAPWESMRTATLSIIESAVTPYRFSRLRIGEGATLGYRVGASLPPSACVVAPLWIEVTGDVEIAGTMRLSGASGASGGMGEGNDRGGYGGDKRQLNSGAGGAGGPRSFSPLGEYQEPEDLLCFAVGGEFICRTSEGARGIWYCNSGYWGYGGAIWEKPSELGLLFEISDALWDVASGDWVSAASASYDVYTESVRIVRKEENLQASTGGGGRGAYPYPATHYELAGFLPPRGGGGGGGSGKAFVECGLAGIDFCRDKAGGGGGGGGGGGVGLRLVAGGTVTIAETGRILASGGFGGRGGDGADSAAAPGGGGGGGAGSQLVIAARELTNNGLVHGAGGLGGPSGAYVEDDVLLLVPKGFGGRGPDGRIRIDEWHRSAGGDRLPFPFETVYRGPRIRGADGLLRGRMRAETITADAARLVLTAELGDITYSASTFVALHGPVDAAEYAYEAIALGADGAAPISSGLRAYVKPVGGSTSVGAEWTLREGLNGLDLHVSREAPPSGVERAFVELHPWERHHVFWYPGAVDSDGDRLLDGVEAMLGTSVAATDTDADGGTDWEEVMQYGTNPAARDPFDEPDLVVGELASSPAAPRVGQPTTLRGTVENRSLRATARASTASVRIVLGLFTTILDTTVAVPALAPGASFAYERGFTPASAGTYTVTIVADATDAVRGEFDEANNTRVLRIVVR